MLNKVYFDESISVVIPLYNKEKNISKTIHELSDNLKSENIEIIIVENNSTDNSKMIANEAVKNLSNKNIKLIESDNGFGNALKKGFENSKNKWIYFVPADFECGLSDIEFVTNQQLHHKYKVFAGSKAHPKTQLDRETSRKIYSIIFNKIVNLLFDTRILDTQGTLIIERQVYEKVDKVVSEGFLFTTELIIKLKELNIDVIEVPLKQINIENNTSTVSPLKDGIKMLYGLFRLKKLIKRI